MILTSQVPNLKNLLLLIHTADLYPYTGRSIVLAGIVLLRIEYQQPKFRPRLKHTGTCTVDTQTIEAHLHGLAKSPVLRIAAAPIQIADNREL